MKQEPCYRRAVVICHGKSELQICKFIRMTLRLPIEIESNSCGKSSIQIESLGRYFNSSYYTSAGYFANHFPGVRAPVRNRLDPNFKIFTWMDVDGCGSPLREDYLQNRLFMDRWFYNHLHPIFCDPKLETILVKAGIPFTSKKDEDRKREYVSIFPTDPKYESPCKNNAREQIEDLYKRLLPIPGQNMHELIAFCLELEKHTRVGGIP